MRKKPIKKSKKTSSKWKKTVGIDILSIIILATTFIITSITAPRLYKTYLKYTTAKHVYRIYKNINKRGGGTGFDISTPSGKAYVLTNSHICDMAGKSKRLYIENQRGMGMFRKIVKNSEYTDLCILEGIPEKDGLKLANSVGIGQVLTVIGHPMLLPITVRQGEILGEKKIKLFNYLLTKRPKKAKCNKPKNKIEYIHTRWGMKIKACFTVIRSYFTDIEIYPGNSGSPVINSFGNVVGIIFAINGMPKWGYFIPFDDIKKFIEKY